MTSLWWVSTPDWTITVTQTQGIITTIAPILWRRWHGQRFGDFTVWVRRRYPGTWQAKRLDVQEPRHG